MRKIVYFMLMVAFCNIFSSRANSQSMPNTANEELRRQMQQAARNEADLERRMRAMRQLESKMAALSKLDSMVVGNAPSLDKKARERVLRLRKINAEDQMKYGKFLAAPRTGIFRLFPDFDCVSENHIRIDGPCAEFVPESSSFSFRTHNYTDKFYHDIGFNNDEIVSNAFFSQGILVSLGDVPIEGADLTHAGLKYLLDLQPDLQPSAARGTAAKLAGGIDSGGYKYLRAVKPAANSTYALRMIAYKIGNSLPPVTDRTSMTELRFHSLAFDKRTDVIIVFRVVRKDPDGNVTILWKELGRKDAPKIKFAKGETLADFKP